MNRVNILKVLISVFSIYFAVGCVPMTVASTAMVGTIVIEERSVGDKIDDNIIVVKIKESFLRTEVSELLERISVNAMEGRVLLTGSVNEIQFKEKAEELAWSVKGVREVINEIEVNTKGLKDRAKEVFIASAVRSKLLFEKDLRSVNYIVDVNNGTVYLLGIAQNQDELDRALKIASSVKGVNMVVNHVIFKDDPRRTRS